MSSLFLAAPVEAAAEAHRRLKVVATLPDYAWLASRIGGDLVEVDSIVKGNQDAHFIRPKPSFVMKVARADVLIATGLDLELWLPPLVDRSGNLRVRSGQPGYVSATAGMRLLEKPKVLSRIEGGVHIYGNPHVTCSPVLMKVAARNIAAGLAKNDPAHADLYARKLEKLLEEFDRRLFGKRLPALLGGDTLCSLAEKGKLYEFLETHSYRDRPLIQSLGGWCGRMLPLRGVPVVTYHKNWVYFFKLFELEEAATVEPKPGIPPSAAHLRRLIRMMKQRGVKILLCANYFNTELAGRVAERAGARAVIVPLYVGGEKGIDDYFKLVDLWVDSLLQAGRQTGILEERRRE